MSPAETLRAAATLIRETASKAAEGHPTPWHIEPHFGDSWWLVGTPAPHLVTSSTRKPVAAWIALMSPAVAEPLAAWLDGVAKDIDGHDPDGGCECTESDSYHRAMDFAAAILGRQS